MLKLIFFVSIYNIFTLIKAIKSKKNAVFFIL